MRAATVGPDGVRMRWVEVAGYRLRGISSGRPGEGWSFAGCGLGTAGIIGWCSMT